MPTSFEGCELQKEAPALKWPNAEPFSWEMFVRKAVELLNSFPAGDSTWAVLRGDGKHKVIDFEPTECKVHALFAELFPDHKSEFTCSRYMYHDIPIGMAINVNVGPKSKSSQNTYFMVAPNKWPKDIEDRILFFRACEKGSANLGEI